MTGISTTQLAKNNQIQPKQLFQMLESNGFIRRSGDAWVLTEKGSSTGAQVVNSPKYGDYITWPDNFDITQIDNLQSNDDVEDDDEAEFLTSTGIGKHFGFSANRINPILSELGWIKKGIKGWHVTEQGQKQGGVEVKSFRSGIPYTKWPNTILDSPILQNTINALLGDGTENKPEEKRVDDIGFREKFEAKHRATDGHFVRSKAEMLIDNFLYMLEIPHAYERRLPIEEEVYCDFYIPTGKVYIEYWGYEDDPRYLARKKAKQDIYHKYGFNLIELGEKEVQNLDDHLPRLLLEFGIQTY
jgi:hypothetical protein